MNQASLSLPVKKTRVILSENKTVEQATESPAAKKYFVTCKQLREKNIFLFNAFRVFKNNSKFANIKK